MPLHSTPKTFGILDQAQVSQARETLDRMEFVPDELLVAVNSSTAEAALAGDLGGAVVESFEGPSHTQVKRMKLPEGTDLAQALVAVKSLPGVAYAEPNQVIRLDDRLPGKHGAELSQEDPTVPNDLRPELWGLHNTEHPGADISAGEAWKISTGQANGPLIAVIDSGADYRHPDLASNIAQNPDEIPGDGIDNDGNGVIDDVFGYNAFEGHGDPLDGMGHGTHVTGTIAAVGNNGQGVVGVNWKARVLPVKIFHDRGLTTTDAILRGLAYAKARGAQITSNSWGGPSYSQAIHDAFAQNPALHIVAAGNDSENNDIKGSYPANYDLPNLVSVGASNKTDAPSWFSNFGRETVDVFAPGEEILSTVPGGEYGVKSGTSMATPHVTGVAGLVAGKFPDESPERLKDRLLYSSDPVEGLTNLAVSGGRLDAARALSGDTIAPASPNDFVVTHTGPREATFSWTATGDDGWRHGAASGFDVRVSSEPITEDNWSQARPLSTPRGKEIGDYLHANYSQLPQSRPTTVFAGFQALDEAGNRSKLVTATAHLPAASTVFSEDFDGEKSAFVGDGRWQREAVEGRGMVWSTLHSGEKEDVFSTLITPSIDLTTKKDSFLRFESRQNFSWSNNVFVEIRGEGDEDWLRLDTLKDRQEWKRREYDLSAFDGKMVQIRVRSENLGSKEGDGMMLDNFEVFGNGKDIPLER